MSYFMSSMFCAGLIEMPPVSNVTPLPTRTTGAPAAPLYSSAMKRGSSALPCATAISAPIPSRDDRGLVEHRDAEPVALGQLLRGAARRRIGVQTLPGSTWMPRASVCPAPIAAPTRCPASIASVPAGASTSIRSSAGFFSSGGRFISLNCQAPCASPSAIAWPASAGVDVRRAPPGRGGTPRAGRRATAPAWPRRRRPGGCRCARSRRACPARPAARAPQGPAGRSALPRPSCR